ncbi:hypothetical protein E4U55_006038 [Claviceps digitariae]|nr:hypothetical protein E4U55_006038 [Claviceps digitariae]
MRTPSPPFNHRPTFRLRIPRRAPAISSSASSPSDPTPEPPDQEAAYLPDVHLLPRPDELLLQPPYHLHISHSSSIQIQCSHGPSLAFLDEYFRKWCRTNSRRTDRPPIVQVTLTQSPFGLGPLHDILTLEYPTGPGRGTTSVLSVPIVLHLVESVLGYELVYCDARNWQYRRDTLLMR